ncbi:MAG: hypothetical protein ACJ8GW_20530 [Massilia sp.]
MGLSFLPWEKLPSWLLGPLMAAVGVFLVLHAEAFSGRQLEAVAFIAIGVGLFIHGVKKLRAKPTGDISKNDPL